MIGMYYLMNRGSTSGYYHNYEEEEIMPVSLVVCLMVAFAILGIVLGNT